MLLLEHFKEHLADCNRILLLEVERVVDMMEQISVDITQVFQVDLEVVETHTLTFLEMLV